MTLANDQVCVKVALWLPHRPSVQFDSKSRVKPPQTGLPDVQLDLTRVELEDVLPSATIMVVTVTASTTAGQPLSEAGIAAVRVAAQHPQITVMVRSRV